MKLEFYCPFWGQENLGFRAFIDKVKNAGYDGVEMGLSADNRMRKDELAIIKDNGLKLIAQHFQTATADFEDYKKEYRSWLEIYVKENVEFINAQTGKDFFSFEQNAQLISMADEISKESGVPIYHETHRGKFSFASHITRHFLEKMPDLKLTLDISHWCAVAESLLQDQTETVELALERTEHIHARIGYMEGPQVPDPRVPEWKTELELHLLWWKKIAQKFVIEKKARLTITPEFGPFPYMIPHPFTGVPITSQWDVNVFMMEYLRSNIS